MHSIVHPIFRYSLPVLLMLLCAGAQAQNVPATSNTSPSGTATAAPVPPQITVDPGGLFNYQRNFVPKVPITDAVSVNNSSNPAEVAVSTEFKDGFNRGMQTVVHDFTSGKSLVTVSDNRVMADNYSYLPYAISGNVFRANAFQEQRDYYNALYPGEGGITYSYSHNASDAGVRKVNAYAPGKSQAGQGRASSITKGTNAANEVKIWTLDGSGLPVANGYYGAGQLFVETAKSPNESTSGTPLQPMAVTYKDKEGKVVWQRTADSSYADGFNQLYTFTSTIYVYDDMGKLRYMLPPKATDLVGTANSVSSAILNNLCFQYTYDNKGRAVATRKPGEDGFTTVVYDRKDRVVMRQNPLEAVHQEWEITFYDLQGRVKATSVYTDPNNYTYSDWQQQMDTWTGVGTTDLLYFLATDAGELSPDPGSVANNVMMSYTWYDNYEHTDPSGDEWNSYANVLQFSTAEQLSTPGAETPLRSLRTQGMVTGSKVRMLPSPNTNAAKLGAWTTSVVFYDDKGRVIYTVSHDGDETNGFPHSQYAGNQYDFAGRLLVSKHIVVNTNAEDPQIQHTEWSKNQYDVLTGRLMHNYHKVDDGAWAVQASYTYDELGRVQRKKLGNGGEVQDYTYNIRGQLAGINGDYAETGNKGGTSKSFGESIKYDYGFSKPRYDGKISGIIWRGSSATPVNGTVPYNKCHAYGYSYDLSGRLRTADYRLWYPTDGQLWSKVTTDYTVSNLNYDKNGNILSMQQRGVKPGTGPVTMDNLSYQYENGAVSNRLGYINDGGVTDYGAGDFQNTNTGTDDYAYDENGNLGKDLNKGITEVSYTSFNKPERVVFSNGNAIEYSYDAAGSKVEELQLPSGSSAKKTSYLGNFVYENNKLQYLNTGEGRTITEPGKAPKEEYFVKDHLGNVRSTIDVFTYPLQDYIASYEIASANLEGLIFDKVGEIREDKPLGNPGDNQAGMLDGRDPSRRIGTSLLLKVMAGDRVAMNVNNFHEGYDPQQDAPATAADMLSSIVSTLTGGVGGMAGEVHDTKMVDQLFNSSNYLAIDGIVNNTATDPSKPKAYLNYVLFDEGMRIVQETTGAFQAGGNGSWEAIGTQVPLEVPQNGYLAVYLSNASSNIVYFDQLWIQVSKGNLLEENHYYPHGLPIQGLSGKTANNFKENKRRYQGNEYNKDMGLNWMDFQARQYDPQLGRFLGVDPLADAQGQQVWSPYAAMGNMPESMVDPNGTDASYSGAEAQAMFVSLQNATHDFIYIDGKAMTASEYGNAAYTSVIAAIGGCSGVVSVMADQQSGFLATTMGSLQSEVESSWQWFEFNKSDLETIVSAKTGLTGGSLQNEAGNVFENRFHAFMAKIHESGYHENNSQFESFVKGRNGVIPDGISDAKVFVDDGVPFFLPGASWYEVKAARGAITKSSFGNQAWGLVTALEFNNPLAAMKGWLNLTFATTHNMSVSSNFIKNAKSAYNINVTQMKSMYRYNNGHFELTFYDPSRISLFTMRYLSPARPNVTLY